MLKNLADNRRADSLAARMRRRRFAFFRGLLDSLPRPIQVLDLGGTEGYWIGMGTENLRDLQITLLNLTMAPTTLPNVRSLAGDARHLDFSDRSFDVVFSNSVIEHVGEANDQGRMAEEARRVGKKYFIQTPNRYFPLEPHFLFPLFQFLPVAVRVWLVQHFDLGWFKRTPLLEQAREIVTGIRLLSKIDMQRFFPGCRIHEEKVLGLTKSITAYGGWADKP